MGLVIVTLGLFVLLLCMVCWGSRSVDANMSKFLIHGRCLGGRNRGQVAARIVDGGRRAVGWGVWVDRFPGRERPAERGCCYLGLGQGRDARTRLPF